MEKSNSDLQAESGEIEAQEEQIGSVAYEDVGETWRDRNGLTAEPKPTDLEWRIEVKRVTGGVRLVHQLTYRLGFGDQFIEGSTEVIPEYQWELRGTSMLDNLEELPEGKSRGEQVLKKDLRQELIGLGQQLWRWVPETVQVSYLSHWQAVESLCLYTKDTWLPWEILLPTPPLEEDSTSSEMSFLCLNHRLTRWRKQKMGAASTLSIRSFLALTALEVRGYPSLKGAEEISVWIEQLDQELPNFRPEWLDALTLKQARDVLAASSLDAIHFDGHGRYDRKEGGRSGLVFHGGVLWADRLPDEIRRAFRRSRPLVFLNACHAARAESTLTGIGGWPGELIPQGLVGALLCPQWQVRHSTADRFAAKVYEKLRSGEVLGEAVREARRELLDPDADEPLSSDDLTPLAYVLYGDPNAVVTFGGGGETRRDRVTQMLQGKLEPALQDDPDMKAATASALLGRNREAAEKIERLIERNGDPQLLLNLSYLHHAGGDLPQAVSAALRYTEKDPTSTKGYLNALKSSLAMHDRKTAQRCIRALKRLAPEHQDTLRASAMLAIEEGDWNALQAAMGGVPNEDIFRRPEDNNVERLRQAPSLLVGENRIDAIVGVFRGEGIRTLLVSYKGEDTRLAKPEAHCKWTALERGVEVRVQDLDIDENEVGMVGFRIEGGEEQREGAPPLLGIAHMTFQFASLLDSDEMAYAGILVANQDRKMVQAPQRFFVPDLIGEAPGQLVSLYQDLFSPAQKPSEKDVPVGEKPLVFFAYAHEDEETAVEIARNLERQGVRVWQDKKSLRIGQKFEDEIEAAIEKADFALILISPNSCGRVGFVNKEIRKILELQEYRPEGIPFALPIKVKECKVPRSLRQLHWLTVTDSLSLFAERLASEIHLHFEATQGRR